MDERVKGIYSKFIKNKMYDKALDVLEASYAEDKKGTYPLILKFRQGQKALAKFGKAEAMPLLRRSFLLTARDVFDDFCIFFEWDRPLSQKFYAPRRKSLYVVTKQLQRLANDELDLLCVSMPPGVGKSALATFFLLWLGGKHPLDGILSVSHNVDFLDSQYNEILRELDPDGEYNWHEVFPECKIVRKNALSRKIDINQAQKFPTFQSGSIGSGLAGHYRAVQLLFCDDLIPNMEVALSETSLNKVWYQYTSDVRQRKLGGETKNGGAYCKELHIATRWSVRDVIGRLKAEYAKDKRAEFLSVPALNAKGESNFDYGGKIGFTKEYFDNMRRIMNDEATFRALFMNEPIERSGLLYPPDELRRFFDLPNAEPDAVWSVCDTKNKGDDYFVQPIAYQYGNDFYVVDFVCDNKNPEIVEKKLVDRLNKHKVQISRFESNSAGGRIAANVQEKIRETGGITKITTKFSTAEKETRIIVNSGYIKEHFLFLDESKYAAEYRMAMNFLVTYTMTGKNRHDDVPDAMSMLADLVQGRKLSMATVIKRPF